jgi:ABC-2 type transport system permease protein
VSPALLRKTAREALPLLILSTAAILIFEIAFVVAIREFAEEAAEFLRKIEPMRRLLQVLVGADLLADFTPTTVITVGLAHPVLYVLMWALLLTTCSRVIAGEIDRGTADLLLALPISRTAIYTSVSAVWVLGGLIVGVAPLVGIWIGQSWFPLSEPIELRRLWFPIVNLYALYLAIGGVAMLISSLVSRRGPAVGVLVGGLVASFFLNFLAQFWAPAKTISFLGVLNYYQPLVTVRAGVWPLGHILVLTALAICTWLTGLFHFSRRDIPAV